MEEKLVATLENKDANSCPVEVCKINEALNGAFTLEFEIPNLHEDLQYIKEKYFVVVEDVDGKDQLFIIQEIEDSHENEFNKRIFCDHASIELADEIIEELFIDRKNSVVAFEAIMLGSKWEIGTLEATIDVHDLTVRLKNRREVIETFLNRWGVEISFEIELSGTTIFKRLMHIELKRGTDIGKRLEYGHNIESITRTINADHVKTALYGKGKEIETQSASETDLSETEELEEESKRYIDFGALDWSTIVKIEAKNLLASWQANPTKTSDLRTGTFEGGTKASITANIPPSVTGVSKSLRATQLIKASDYIYINNFASKTRVTAGTAYTFSFYARTNKSSATLQLQITWYDGKGKKISSPTLTSVTADSNTWYRLDARHTAPTGAILAIIEAKARDVEINDWIEATGLMIQTQELTDFTATETKGSQEFNKPKGQKWIGDDQARLLWGRYNPTTGLREHRYGIYENTSIDNPVDLLLDTYNQLPSYTTPQITYEVKEIALGEILGLSQLKTRIGDETIIIDKDLGISLQARAIERESDLIDESNSDLTFGDFHQLLSIQELKRNLSLEAQFEAIKTPPLPESILEEGANIPTSWLEGEINALKNELIAGSGTVTITEENGILIESADKTKALRLLGGMLALADEKDAITGEYNWSSFGTGEGFLADLVQTGFIRFERAKGGTLTLGGEIIAYDPDGKPIYENGTLVVYGSEMEADGRPIVVSLNGNDGGFDKLSIGELTNVNGTNIVTKTTGQILPNNRRGSDIVFYVDPIDGDDNNIGTEAEPRKTVQSCINALPVYIDVNVYIYVLPTLLDDTDILIEGFIGHGYIYIELWDVGAKTRYIRDWIDGSTANGGKHWVEVRGIKASDSGIVHAGGTTYPERMKIFRSDTMSDITATDGVNLGRASDGDITYNMYAMTSFVGATILDVYLGGLYDLKEIDVFHYWIDGRTYYKTKVQVSEDGGTGRWYTIFDSARQGEYPEVAGGKKHDLKHAYMNGRIKINTCMVNVRIDDIICNGAGVNNPTFDCFHTNYVETRNSVFFGDVNYDYAVYANGSNVRMIDCEVNTAKTSGIIGAYGGRIEIQDVVGSGFPYAITAHSSSVVAGAGKAPVGSTANTRILNGGQLTATWTHTGGSLYVAPIVQKTSTWVANDTQSLFGTNWSLSSYVYQGKRPTESTAWYGVFFFNSANFGALAGKTIKSVRVKVQRTNNTGENTARKPKFYYNMQTSPSGSLQATTGGHNPTVSFTWGQEKWVTLPNSYGEAFKNGTAKSLVLWVGTSTSEYMRFEPKATLEITYV